MTIDTIAHGRCSQRKVHLEEFRVHRSGLTSEQYGALLMLRH